MLSEFLLVDTAVFHQWLAIMNPVRRPFQNNNVAIFFNPFISTWQVVLNQCACAFWPPAAD